MGGLATRLRCAGCGAPAGVQVLSCTCPAARPGDGVDHVLRREVDPAQVAFPTDPDPNPFVAFRALFLWYQRARAAGLPDAECVALVRALDARVALVDGRGFQRTPLEAFPALSKAVGWRGELWVKNETGNVSGSHKSRHMLGLQLYLEVARRLGEDDGRRRLALSSCGNAALAAAVVAKAAERPLDVFVPTWADPSVVDRLAALGAHVVRCAREAGTSGDPCTHRFRAEVLAGAFPFSCQGPDNGLVIEGGLTLGYELIAAGPPPDRVFVQVGGGALASACAQAFEEAVALGRWDRLPVLHAVQTEGAAPLHRAYLGVLGRLMRALGAADRAVERRPSLTQLATWAAWVRERWDEAVVRRELAYAAAHRAEFMWPWEEEPKSAAHGILDDETYDWLRVVEGMLHSGGFPIVVPEANIEAARALGREHTQIQVDATGTSGLAGCLTLAQQSPPPKPERALVLFTGRDRHPA